MGDQFQINKITRELKPNIVNSISNISTDEEIPSAKAVYDFVTNLVNGGN